jgi:hypothetical protein
MNERERLSDELADQVFSSPGDIDGRSEAGRSDGWAEEAAQENALGWYLRRRHKLIRRHQEQLILRSDHTASWELRVDLELPTEREIGWRAGENEFFFPFPLALLKKVEGRMGFSVTDERGEVLSIPTRQECDALAITGLAEAANALAAEIRPRGASFPPEQLRSAFELIVVQKPYRAAMALLKLRRQVGLAEPDAGDPDDLLTSGPPTQRQAAFAEIGQAWKESGLDEMLGMLVEHSLLWVRLRGHPGERRSILIREEKVLRRRPVVRWAFGELRQLGPLQRRILFWRAARLRSLRGQITADAAAGHASELDRALAFRGRPCGRRHRTFSFSALGERIGQPLAWMPFEFEFPTIYMTRCASYHFELVCPPGRAPRDVRVAVGPALAEPAERRKIDETHLSVGSRKTLTGRIARLDVPPFDSSRDENLRKDAWFRVTVGIGDGAFPVLWFLVGGITALLLWLLADADPHLKEVEIQIAAAILLLVPALVSALALGSNEVPIGQLVGGARILVLVSGLSAVAAAAILAGARPFEMGQESAWAACAMIATASAVPLATGWLLSSPLVWEALKLLDSRRRQWAVLVGGVGLALMVVGSLIHFCHGPISRGILAVILLVLPVGMSLVANDRAAMKVNESRNYIAVSFLAAGFICLGLACIELRGAIAQAGALQSTAQWIALGALPCSLLTGLALSRGSASRLIAPKGDEVHVSPITGRALIAGEAVRELVTLQERQDRSGRESETESSSAVPKGRDPLDPVR